MKTVSEISKTTGISVRTLHYYDQIGLLSPTTKTEKGYRLYDEKSLEILQQILFFKELGFKLKDIKKIINSSSFDKIKALENHKNLLLMKRKHIDDLICLVNKTMEGNNMSFKEFDDSSIREAQEKYKQEIENKWGNTKEYKQSVEKANNYTKNEWEQLQQKVTDIYNEFANNMNKSPSDIEVQKLVKEWQKYITTYYYDCSNDILRNLGEMYVNDERFKNNIDSIRRGLAEFINEAIKIYTK